jgi:hypothetical protein
MMRFAAFSCAALLLLGIARPSAGQAIAPPVRPGGGLFAQNRSGDQSGNGLSGTFTLGGGYDQSVDPVDSEGVPQPVGTYGGALGTADASLRFRTGTTTRFLEANGIAYVQSASVSPSALVGGDGNVRTTTDFGGRSGMTGALAVSFQPSMLFNAFGPIGNQLEGGTVPGGSAPQGITEQRWRAVNGSAGLYRNWTTRQRTDVTYNGAQRVQISGGPELVNHFNAVAATHAWNLRERVGLDFNYDFSRNSQDDQAGIAQNLNAHTARLGLRLVKPLATSRQLAFTLGGGVTRAATEFSGSEDTFVLPVVSGSLRWDPARDWSITADAGRDVTVLEGLSPEPFAANIVLLSVRGTATRRLELAVSASYSRGAATVTETGSFQNVAGIAQMQFAASRWAALYASYSFYHYTLFDVTLVQPGFPSRYALNSLRSGLTIWFPLAGRS